MWYLIAIIGMICVVMAIIVAYKSGHHDGIEECMYDYWEEVQSTLCNTLKEQFSECEEIQDIINCIQREI